MFGQKKDKPADVNFFTVYDSKSQTYRIPMPSFNDQTIVREIMAMMRDPAQSNNELLTNAEDFSLFRVGTYDKTTGLITAFNPEHVANFNDLRSQVQSYLAQAAKVGIVNPT